MIGGGDYLRHCRFADQKIVLLRLVVVEFKRTTWMLIQRRTHFVAELERDHARSV